MGILNKEDGSIVSHQVENALFSVKLGRKSPYISDRIRRACAALNRRESDKNRGDFIFITQKVRFRRRAETGIGLKVTVSGRTSGMYDPLRDAFMIKMGDFFPQDEVFQQSWPTVSGAQRVLIVRNAHALIGGQGKILASFAKTVQRVEFVTCDVRRF